MLASTLLAVGFHRKHQNLVSFLSRWPSKHPFTSHKRHEDLVVCECPTKCSNSRRAHSSSHLSWLIAWNPLIPTPSERCYLAKWEQRGQSARWLQWYSPWRESYMQKGSPNFRWSWMEFLKLSYLYLALRPILTETTDGISTKTTLAQVMHLNQAATGYPCPQRVEFPCTADAMQCCCT